VLAVCGGVRTPFVRSFGKYTGMTADDLARAVFVETLARTGADPAELDEVILGCAGPPVEAMNIARVTALRSGVPEHVPAFSVHRNCASGIESINQALLRVRANEGGGLVLAGGTESMSEAPFQLRPQSRRKLVAFFMAKGLGHKWSALRRLRPGDLMARETIRTALTDPISGLSMGDTAEVLAREFQISREEQDQYAAESQQRSVQAREAGIFRDESLTCFLPPSFRRMVEHDDGLREGTTPEKLARLKPVFDRRFGTVTVGNACQITDGAAALLLGSMDRVQELGLPVLGLVRDVVNVGCDPKRMGLGPALAIPKLLERNQLEPEQIDLYEINEAFAVQVLACLKALGAAAPPRDRLNVNGGAIALGHPVGATGLRIVLTLLLSLRRRKLPLGVASLCVGGGQGAAVLLENPEAA